MNTHSNIIAHIPQDLRTNHTTTRGAWRDATRKIAPGASFMETKTTLDALLLDGVKVTNDKGVERLTARIKKALNGRLLMTRGLKASRRRRGLVATFMTVEPENLRIVDLEIACEPGRGLVWRYEMAGRVSSHAAARYIERCGDPDISLVTIAESAVLTLRFVRQLRRFDDISRGMVFTSRIVPVPDVAGDMVAVVDLTQGEIITCVNQKMLHGRRAAWLEKFNAYDALVKSDDIVIETQAPGYVRLLNEGAAIWESTRPKSEEVAA